MSLTIHRMHTRLRTAAAVAPHRLSAWQDELRHQDGDRIAARWTSADEWVLIRHLPLRLRWREDPSDADVGRAWGEALEQAIARALQRDDGNCVRYANRQAALADLVYRAALGDTTRHWAWQRMELIPRTTLRSEQVLRHAAAELARTPELVWPVLMRLVSAEEATASLTAALRALPHAAWQRLFEACPRTAGFARRCAQEAPSVEAPTAATVTWNAEVQSLLQWAAARPWLVQKHRPVLTVLLCAGQRSAQALTDSGLREHLAIASRALATLLPTSTPEAPPAHTVATEPRLAKDGAAEAPATSLSPPSQQKAATPTEPRQATLPELPHADSWLPTRFAGALFWLAQLPIAELLAHLEAGDDALPLYLRELAFALGVPADDPVLQAFCGGTTPRGDASPATIALAQAQATGWEQWLAVAAPELPPPRLHTVCQRAGGLRMEPGWIELHLPLSSVDTAIRRLGLDLDPGWLAWLGCVVRIIYEAA